MSECAHVCGDTNDSGGVDCYMQNKYGTNDTLNQSLTHSLPQCLPRSLTPSLTHFLVYSLTHSLTSSLTDSLTHPLTNSLTHQQPPHTLSPFFLRYLSPVTFRRAPSSPPGCAHPQQARPPQCWCVRVSVSERGWGVRVGSV